MRPSVTCVSALVALSALAGCTGAISEDRDASFEPRDVALQDALVVPSDAGTQVPADLGRDAAPAATDEGYVSDAPPVQISPWPPEELVNAAPVAQPTGDGWRTAQWNICTTSMDGSRIECRARIDPADEERTAAQLERAAIASYFLGDPNMYSFTLQEVCEQDARWIAAFVANGGPPAAGWDRDFNPAEYAQIDELAPYAFLPYVTREMSNGRDYGCGVGISTGVAAIAKRTPDTTGLKLQGLTNATYADRAVTGFTQAHLQTSEFCNLYFQAQTSFTHTVSTDDTSPYLAVRNFRTTNCTSDVPVTLRGVACVRTRWQAPGNTTTYRVSTCALHLVHRGRPAGTTRNHQMSEAISMSETFAGGDDQRIIISGDFNVVPRRGNATDLNGGEVGHETMLTSSQHGFAKVTVGDHTTSSSTGTLRTNCGREIDAIYTRNAWWMLTPAPRAAPCVDYPDTSPPTSGPTANPFIWSDHVMMVSPLMSPIR